MSQVAPGQTKAVSLSVPEFWQFAIASQLVTPQQAQVLQQTFAQQQGPAAGHAPALIEWLIAGQYISRFQANVLAARQPGPFIFGEYRIYDRIETGRLQGVFRAVHSTTNQPVCLLFLAGPAAQDPGRLAHVAKEAAIFSGIQHPHLTRAYHFADLQTYRYVVLENLHGQSLDELLAKGPLPASEACRITRQLALGLMALDDRKLVHGELRPQNVWINHLGTTKLIGFPLDHDALVGREPVDTSTAANPQSRLARNADYLAPEVVRSGGALDIRADIYSLGCVLYQMLTGRVPFADPNTFQKVLRHASEPVVSPEQLNPQVPIAVSQLVMYLLAKDPGQRYQKPAHVAEALAPYIDPQGLTTFADPPTPSSQQYDAWLSARFPAAEPDADTGEFHINIHAADFAQSASTRSASPGFAGFGTASQPAAPLVDHAAHAAQQFGQPQQFSPAPQFSPSGASAGVASSSKKSSSAPTAAPKAMSAADRERLEEEKFNKQVMQWAYIGGGVVAFIVVAAVAIGIMNKKPVDPALAAATSETSTPVASVSGTPTTSGLRPVTTASTPSGGGVTRPAGTGPSTGTPADPATVTASSEWEAMYGDNRTLWAPPFAGPREPLVLKHLPLGVQMIVALRPADLLSKPEGKKSWEALGTWGEYARLEIETLVGSELENVEQVVFGFLDNADQPPKLAMVASLRSPPPLEGLLASWGNPVETPIGGAKMYVANRRAFYIPPGNGGKVVALCPDSEAKDIVGDAPPTMRRELELLVETADARSHVLLLCNPNFLFAGGKSLFTVAGMKRLRDPLDAALRVEKINYAQALMVAMHLGDEYFYTELRLHGGNQAPPTVVMRDLRSAIEQVPLSVLQFYQSPSAGAFGFVPTDYSRNVLARYPKMLDAWTAYVASATENKVVVLNTVVPTIAAHNLVLGTQLAIRDPGIDTSGGSSGAPTGPQTLEEKLKSVKIPLVLARDSLDRVLAQLSEENQIPIRIEGPDLQLDGITKNQSFGVDIKDPVPFAQVLEKILFQANTDKTCPDIGDVRQKLVFVISPDKQTVVVTTRAKALERGTPWPSFKVAKQ